MYRAISLALPLAGLAACGPAQVTLPIDSDADGLMDADELALGTDPQSSDTDDDGWTDGEEADSGTDPLDPEDHPYTGGWPMDGCADQLEGTGYQVGDVSPDFALMDQYGDTVHLWDFCDHAVYLIYAQAT